MPGGFLNYFSRAVAVLIALVGSSVFIGWCIDIPILKSILPQYVSMKANTSIAFILIGISLFLNLTGRLTKWKSLLADIPSIIVALIGTLTLIEYAASINLSIDELLFKDTAPLLTSHPGRMSPLTAINFLSAGTALFLIKYQEGLALWLQRIFACIIGTISYFIFLTYIYNLTSLGKLSSYTQMAIHTAALFLLLSFALLILPNRRGLYVYLSNKRITGSLVRLMCIAVLTIPPFLGWLRLFGERKGLYDADFGVALFATSMVLTITIYLFYVAKLILGLEMEQIKTLCSLEHSNTLNKSLLETIPLGVEIVDEQRNILFMNNAMEQMLGGRPIGRKCHELLKDDKQPCLHCPLYSTFKHRETKVVESRDILGGRTFEISHTAMVFDGKKAVMEVFHDITDRKNAEEALNRANMELLYAHDEIKKLLNKESEFISMVSHELRTPFAIIKEDISLILDEVAGEINDKQKKLLGSSLSNIDRLLRLVNNILDVKMIKAGKAPLNKEEFDITEAVKQAANAFESRISAKGLSLKLCLPKPGIIVNADRDKVIQIFTNLIGNAYKFTDKGHIEISTVESGGFAQCSISDTGIGIPKEHIDDIFVEFKQLSKPATADERGSGLGLSIVKSLVELHGGRIWVESSEGFGSKFTFTIPK